MITESQSSYMTFGSSVDCRRKSALHMKMKTYIASLLYHIIRCIMLMLSSHMTFGSSVDCQWKSAMQVTRKTYIASLLYHIIGCIMLMPTWCSSFYTGAAACIIDFSSRQPVFASFCNCSMQQQTSLLFHGGNVLVQTGYGQPAVFSTSW